MTSEVHKNNLDGVEEIVSEKNSFQRSKMEWCGDQCDQISLGRSGQPVSDLLSLWEFYRHHNDAFY